MPCCSLCSLRVRTFDWFFNCFDRLASANPVPNSEAANAESGTSVVAKHVNCFRPRDVHIGIMTTGLKVCSFCLLLLLGSDLGLAGLGIRGGIDICVLFCPSPWALALAWHWHGFGASILSLTLTSCGESANAQLLQKECTYAQMLKCTIAWFSCAFICISSWFVSNTLWEHCCFVCLLSFDFISDRRLDVHASTRRLRILPLPSGRLSRQRMGLRIPLPADNLLVVSAEPVRCKATIGHVLQSGICILLCVKFCMTVPRPMPMPMPMPFQNHKQHLGKDKKDGPGCLCRRQGTVEQEFRSCLARS